MDGKFFGVDILTEFRVSKENEFFVSKEGVLFNKDLTILISWPDGKTELNIPDSVTEIGDNTGFYLLFKPSSISLSNLT